MSTLTLPNYRGRAFRQSPQYIPKKLVNDFLIWGGDLCLKNGGSISLGVARKRSHFRVYAMCTSSSSSSALNMNLNEYMVTLEKPLGIRFALSVDGYVFVHSLKKGVRSFTLFSILFYFTSILFQGKHTYTISNLSIT